MRNEVLHRVKDERHVLHTINRRKVNFVGLILRGNCVKNTLLKEIHSDKGKDRSEGKTRKKT